MSPLAASVMELLTDRQSFTTAHTPNRRKSKISMRQVILCSIGVLWLAAVVFGMRKLSDYDNTAGAAASALAAWPANAAVRRSADKPTLILFAHPRCPCTRATLSELDQLMARVHNRLNVTVLFYRPADSRPGWEKTDLWDHAVAIPEVTVLSDPDGVVARTFGATTSGQALLYDGMGRIRFRGGITGARGKSGDNAGSRTVLALVNGQRADAITTPVFGCSLIGPAKRN